MQKLVDNERQGTNALPELWRNKTMRVAFALCYGSGARNDDYHGYGSAALGQWSLRDVTFVAQRFGCVQIFGKTKLPRFPDPFYKTINTWFGVVL